METKTTKSNKVTCTVIAGGKNESSNPTVVLNNKSHQSNEKLTSVTQPSKQVRSMSFSTNEEIEAPKPIESKLPDDDKLMSDSITGSDSRPTESMPTSTGLMLLNNEQKYTVLLNRFDEIISLLDSHKGHIPHGNTNGIMIKLPNSNKSVRTTVRVNSEVWEMFKDLCDQNQHYTKCDLLGQAILEFVNSHKHKS